MRQGSAANFAPPVKEGLVYAFQDEVGELVNLEFLGLIIHKQRRFGFFFEVNEDAHVGDSGELIILEVSELDSDGQPAAFELVLNEALAAEVYADFRKATKEMYDFF